MSSLRKSGLSLFLLLLLGGCGGGGGGSASFENTGTSSSVSVVSCNNTNTSWTTLSSGNTVASQESGTVLVWDHSQDNTKRVCVSSGSALVI